MKLKLTILGTMWFAAVFWFYGWFGLTYVQGPASMFYWGLGWLFPIVAFLVPFFIYAFSDSIDD